MLHSLLHDLLSNNPQQIKVVEFGLKGDNLAHGLKEFSATG